MKEILKDLISFNTINDKDNSKIINYIEDYLKGLGFTTEYKSKCLVMSNKKDCDIGFLGHTDTVDYSSDWNTNPFELTEIDNKLYGLGTCDMKGSIAVILNILKNIEFTNKGIRLFFTYDEELGLNGIKELVEKKISFPETIIVGEPTNNEIINASKGLLELKLTFKGKTSHASTPLEGINAIDKCIKFINELNIYYKELQKEIINSKYATMNIGLINGGRSANVVPDICTISIDFRTVSENQNEEIINKIKSITNDKVEVINNINPFISDPNNINQSDYITEASLIDSKNRLILGVGPVNPHKPNEYIRIESMEKLEKQYIDIIKKRLL